LKKKRSSSTKNKKTHRIFPSRTLKNSFTSPKDSKMILLCKILENSQMVDSSPAAASPPSRRSAAAAIIQEERESVRVRGGAEQRAGEER